MEIGWIAAWLATGAVAGMATSAVCRRGRSRAVRLELALGLAGGAMAWLILFVFEEGRNGLLGIVSAGVGGVAMALFRRLIVARRPPDAAPSAPRSPSPG